MTSRGSRILYGVAATWAVLMVVTHPHELPAQEPERPNIEELEFAELEFVPPEALQYTLEPGVDVFFLEDHTLPLVSVYARFRGGPRHFSRDELGAATAVPTLLRSGGTTELPPDSVDKLLEFYAAETTFGGGGGTSFSSVNMLTRHLDDVLAIWGDLLKNPAFDPAPVEVWRGQELEDVRRKQDTAGRLAISKFNRLLFGDHPVGWELGAEDLEPEDLTAEALKSIHRRIYCLDNLTLGVTGDVTWEEMRPKLEAGLADWSPCSAPLSEPSPSNTVVEPGVYLVPRELEQSTVVIGRPSGVRLADDPEYFSSRIGNSILGASGLTSRLVMRVRTKEGLAYSAASVWTAPMNSVGIVGAITQTKSESTVATIRLILDVLREMSTDPPDDTEVKDAIDHIVNGFVFNFQSSGQIVSRQMLYVTQGLPLDWLARYLDGIQGVTAEGVETVFRKHLPPHEMDEMVILVVGDPDGFDAGLDELGTIRIGDLEEGVSGDGDVSSDSDVSREGSETDADVDGGDPAGQEPPLHIPEPGLAE